MPITCEYRYTYTIKSHHQLKFKLLLTNSTLIILIITAFKNDIPRSIYSEFPPLQRYIILTHPGSLMSYPAATHLPTNGKDN